MNLCIGNTYTRDCLKYYKFPNWDLQRAFIFEETLNPTYPSIDSYVLVGIVSELLTFRSLLCGGFKN